MKKFIIFILALLLITPMAYANDGGPNPAFWVKNDKINCLSVADLENLPTGYFMLFDYSSKAGENLGKPWAIVEKGKCYQQDDTGGVLFLVKIITGNEDLELEDYKRYESADNVAYSFTYEESYSVVDKKGNVIKLLLWPINEYESSPTYSYDDETRFIVQADAIFPTTYNFGNPITSHQAVEINPQIAENPAFVEITYRYPLLARQLETTINSCDNRIRIEQQYQIKPQAINNIWKFKNGSTFKVTANLDPLLVIEKIGCRVAFSNFINEHREDFANIDELAKKVLKDTGGSADMNQVNEEQIIFKRDTKEIERINMFAGGHTVSFNNKPIEYYQWLYADNFSPAVKESESMSTPMSEAVRQDTSSTIVDEPTGEKKADVLKNSSNPLMQVYIMLPLLALIGIIAIVLLKKRRQ